MRMITTTTLLASAVMLAGCYTVRGVGSDVASIGYAFDPNRTYAACGSQGPIDRNNDGRISNSEWNDYRTRGFSYWDTNRDGRISRAEYANCWYGGGFHTTYNRSAWQPSFNAFDTNRNGYLSRNEYWGTSAYSIYDRNRDGVIDSSEWPW